MDEARLTIDLFMSDISAILGSNLYEIIIHGSYALGDFTPHRGDLDYTVLTRGNLDDSDVNALFNLHDNYRKEKKLLLYQLEGTTYPRQVAADPRQPFVGCYIGTRRKGWRKAMTFPNSLMDLKIMEQCGIRLLGADLVFYQPSDAEIQSEQLDNLKGFRRVVVQDPAGIGFWYALVHLCARAMFYREHMQVASKSEACRWCAASQPSEFAQFFLSAVNQRYPYGDQLASKDFKKACIDLLSHTEERILGMGVCDLRVEPATADDIGPWLDLAREVGGLFGADMASDPGFLEHLKRSVARGSAFCIRVGGELAGAMIFRDGWIRWLAVGQRFRQQGVGRTLVLHAVTAGAREVRVTTFGEQHPHPGAQAARSLYRSMGFVSSSDVPEAPPDGTSREVLVWRSC